MEPERSPHIHYSMQYTRYHSVVADLVLRNTRKGGRVLDIGCGLGHVLSLVRQGDPGLELVAADPDPRCLQLASERVDGLKTVRIREESLDLDLLGGPNSTVVMCHSLEHMLRPWDTVRDVLSIIEDGGHLVLAVPNVARPTVLLSSARRDHYVNRGHAYAWDRSHWINFLERILGLEVIEYASDEVRLFSGRLRRLGFLKRFEIALSRILPWWSFSNIAAIRKRPGDPPGATPGAS